MKENKGDMTVGSPGTLIIRFAIPMILGNIVQQLYSMVDSAVVGRFVGKEALASVGATISVLSLIICVIIGLTMGTCIITSQYFGAGENGKVRAAAGTAVYICFGMWIVIAGIGCIAAEPALRLLNTPEEVISEAEIYLIINFSTSLAPITYNMSANIMRALGDSKGPLYAVITSSVLNVILDVVFVLVFHWGVAGVAWATAVSQAASTLVNLSRIRKRHKILHLKREDLKPDPGIVKQVIAVGVPMSVQNAVASAGALGVQKIINQYGTDTVAAYTVAGKIDQIAWMPLNSLGMAVSTYVGQNFGKRDVKRMKAGVKAGVLQALAMGAGIMVIITLFGEPLTRLFVSGTEKEVIHISMEYFRTVSYFYWLCGLMYVFVYVFRGMGMMKISTIASCLEPLAKLGAVVVLGNLFGRSAIWFAWPIGWFAALVIPLLFYKKKIDSLVKI